MKAYRVCFLLHNVFKIKFPVVDLQVYKIFSSNDRKITRKNYCWHNICLDCVDDLALGVDDEMSWIFPNV